jgi:hypothetical protein
MVAISSTSEPASASLVTEVPRRSWKVRSSRMPAFLQALPQLDRNPSSARAVPLLVVSTTVATCGVPSS